MSQLKTSFDAIAKGQHSNPFAVLGPHSATKNWVVRSWQPQARSVELLDANNQLLAVMKKVHADGLFEARLPLPMTICLYRFAQEALNNAFRHAGGEGQSLSARYDGVTIAVEVSDAGPGFAVDQTATGDERLGLAGLRYRVDSLGGTLQIDSQSGHGTRLIAQFRNPLAPNK